MSDLITTIGNFLTQPNQDFPHDCELYESMQDNIFLTSIIGNITGNKMILYGCELENNGTSRRKGYVFVRTNDYPQGEILFWEGGNISNGMFLDVTPVAVSVQGNDYSQAYYIRKLSKGIGEEWYSWNDFKELITIPQLEEKITSLEREISQADKPRFGFPEIFAGVTIPDGYLLCDGQQYLQTDYPELYKAIGNTYNTKPDYNGTTQSTTSGYFRVPDLRGRFIVGYNSNDTEYRTYGNAGGKKTVSLSVSEMPSHTHRFMDYYYPEGYSSGGLSATDKVGTNFMGSGKSDNDNSWLFGYEHATYQTGSGSAHENRPPWYTLAYIMRAK